MSLVDDLQSARDVLASLSLYASVLEASSGAIVRALSSGHKVLTCGNGGSAAEAEHFVTELVGRFCHERRSLPALFLGGNASQLTCIANDFSWQDSFRRPLSALAEPGDVLVAFSSSGNSANVNAALGYAREQGIESLALLGKGGGDARGLATWEVIVPSDDTARIQEAHLFIVHWLCGRLEVECGR